MRRDGVKYPFYIIISETTRPTFIVDRLSVGICSPGRIVTG
jgi:hypothetical protein